jgi:hypothetical protein
MPAGDDAIAAVNNRFDGLLADLETDYLYKRKIIESRRKNAIKNVRLSPAFAEHMIENYGEARMEWNLESA